MRNSCKANAHAIRRASMSVMSTYHANVLSLVQQHSPSLFAEAEVARLQDLLNSLSGACSADAEEVRTQGKKVLCRHGVAVSALTSWHLR